jgi:DNA-binding transcriptional LysR family regulator
VGLTTSRIDEKVLRTEILNEVEAVCVMSKDHTAALEGTITPKHFSESNLITLDGDDDLNDEWRRILADRKVKPRSVIETTYSATICTLAAAGAGMGVVNPYIASVFADRLHIAPLKPAVRVKAFVAYPRHVAASTLTPVFVEFLDASLNQKRRTPGQKRT